MPNRLEQRIYKSLFIIESDHTKSDLINYSLSNFAEALFLHNILQILSNSDQNYTITNEQGIYIWKEELQENLCNVRVEICYRVLLKKWAHVPNKRLKWLPNLKSIFSASIILSQVHLETEKMIFRINKSSRLNVREGSNRSLQLKKNTFISFYSCFAYDALEHWSVWQYKAPLFHSWFLLFVFLIFCTASDVFFHQFLVVFIDNSEHSETKLKCKNQKTKIKHFDAWQN